MSVVKYQEGSIRNSVSLPKLVLLPFFRDGEVRLEKELEMISSREDAKIRKSRLYTALEEVVERLKV
jgi:hypothetical protein